jgi:hypothetical protein
VDIAPSLADVDLAEIRGLSWSPNSVYLSFIEDSGQNGCWLIQLLHLDDIVVTPLRPMCYFSAYVDEPQWSPDGQWLVFTADPDGEYEGDNGVIATINVAEALHTPDNVVPHYLTSGPGDYFPRWQP